MLDGPHEQTISASLVICDFSTAQSKMALMEQGKTNGLPPSAGLSAHPHWSADLLSLLRIAGAATILLAGHCCAAQDSEKTPKAILVPPAQAAIVGKGEELERNANGPAEGKQIPRREGKGAGSAQPPFIFDERQACQHIAAEIRDALSLRKTLVVWLVEQTADSRALARNTADQIRKLSQEFSSVEPGRLQMAIVGYGDKVNLVTPEPIADAAQLQKALSRSTIRPTTKRSCSPPSSRPSTSFSLIAGAATKSFSWSRECLPATTCDSPTKPWWRSARGGARLWSRPGNSLFHVRRRR